MSQTLAGKIAIVTGAAGNGLGRAQALALGKLGAKIAVFDRVSASETTALLAKESITAKSYECDISNASAVQAAVDSVIKDFGKIDILINNAGILDTVGMFSDIPVDSWNRDIQVNIIGTANVTRAVWPHLLKNGWGRVVFISSIAGLRGGAGQTSYATTKAAVIGLAKSLALEGAKAGITVNAVAPGVMATETAQKFIREDMQERMKKKIPLRRFGEPSEVANVVAFLASDAASYMTGQVLTADGGSGLFVF